MATYGVGVAGTGSVSGEHIKAFEKNPHTQIVALCSRTKEGAQAKAAEMGVDAAIYTDYAEMIARDDIHIVSIATPPHLHAEEAIAAAQAGKHILLEKAMATTLEGARAIRDAVETAGVKSVVSFVLRWNPLLEIIKTQLANGAIGRIILGEVDYFHGIGPEVKLFELNRRKDVGVSSLLLAGCHAVDAMRWFMDGEIVEVFQYATRGGAPPYDQYEYAPTSSTLCRFDDGRIAKVSSCVESVQPYVFNINLVGTQGTIKNNTIYSPSQFPGQTSWAAVPTIMPDSGAVTHHPFEPEINHLVDCIREDKESHCNIADACKTHEVCFAADQSGETGQPVKLPLP